MKLYDYAKLKKNRMRNNERDIKNQTEFICNLQCLDIASNALTTMNIEEDNSFLSSSEMMKVVNDSA